MGYTRPLLQARPTKGQTIFILRKDRRGSENGNFHLLYLLKMSLRRGGGGSKKVKIPLHNIKMVPKTNTQKRKVRVSI